MKIEIEPVKIEELETLTKISRDTFVDTFSGHNTREDMELFLEGTFCTEILKAEMEQADNHFFFARHGSIEAGYLKLSTPPVSDTGEEDCLEISRIYVVKEQLGNGIGKALMEFAFAFAQKKNKKCVYLGVWENNERAIRFYQRFGFKKCGEHIFIVGTDPQTDWLMKKDLGRRGGTDLTAKD
jgi:ribosomal protein S18 acetylase RimI-like enzyme